jgi:hypothetical protein
MLRNVICCFELKVFGALKLISWKYTFKRLNEEYEIAKKKQQAIDNLYTNGKISQPIRDSFSVEISSAIVAIEKQQKELVEGMQTKTSELENQLRTLETLLASYEIQHVAGEIDEDIYQREINLLSTGLETTKNELNTIKQVTYQLTTPVAPTVQAPAAPEPVALIIQEVAQPAIQEPTPAPTIAEAPTIETVIIETAVEPAPIESSPVETSPIEIPVEVVKAEESPVETAPIETPIETAPVEAAPIETVATPIETPPIEIAPAPVETPVETVPVVEVVPIETATIEVAPDEVPVEVAPVETPVVDVAPVEAAPVALVEPEVHEINEPAPEIAPQEPAIIEPAIEEPIVNVEAAASETTVVVEEAAVEVEVSEIAPAEVVQETKEPEVESPIEAFEVTPTVAEVETTLDKMIEPAIESAVEPVILEEVQVPVHPLEAPQAAQTETAHEQNENETVAETEDSNNHTE